MSFSADGGAGEFSLAAGEVFGGVGFARGVLSTAGVVVHLEHSHVLALLRRPAVSLKVIVSLTIPKVQSSEALRPKKFSPKTKIEPQSGFRGSLQ